MFFQVIAKQGPTVIWQYISDRSHNILLFFLLFLNFCFFSVCKTEWYECVTENVSKGYSGLSSSAVHARTTCRIFMMLMASDAVIQKSQLTHFKEITDVALGQKR